MRKFDLVALGGGTGGLAAARAATNEGKSAALITDGPIGGDCTWTGCVPSKALIAAAAEGVDFVTAMGRVHAAVEHIAATEDAGVLSKEGVTVIEGRGVLSDRNTIVVDGTSIEAENIVLATGATPAIPPIPGLAEVPFLSSDNLWDVTAAPASLGVLGGGAIGCELAQAMARLGVKVSLFEMASRVLPLAEPEASEVVHAALVADGVDVVVDQAVTKVVSSSAGRTVTVVAGTRHVEVEQILVAVGRRPTTADMGLEAVGVEISDRGFVTVDKKLRTNVKNIWAVGDVNGLMPFTHAADEQGRLAAWAASGRRMTWTFDATKVPSATFTSPEVAGVGVLEAEAPAGAMVAYLPMTENDRAIASGATAGFIKLIAAPRRILRNVGGGKIIGATIVGERAGEMIHEPALMMLTNAFTGRLAQLAHAYPSWSVGVQKCAGQFFQEVEGRSARAVSRA